MLDAVQTPIQIAIDGYSSCGKSTLAKSIAQALGYLYIDSGAMYRAITLHFLNLGISPDDHPAAAAVLKNTTIHFQSTSSGVITLLNGLDVEARIREMDVAAQVSRVAAIPAVRRALVQQQRQLAANQGVAMDGRDIGTVVFPNAALKIFLTAQLEVRVERRYLQLKQQGRLSPVPEIRRNLLTRDYLDSTRSDSPLRKAADGIVIDNSNLSITEQSIMVLALAEQRIKGLKKIQTPDLP